MNLNELKDNKGSRKAPMRVGRGMSSGKGKTSGSGQKGQSARTGVSFNGFEGGQTPMFRRLPKRGFVNPFRQENIILNLGQIQKAVEAGKLDGKKVIDRAALLAAGLITSKGAPIKVLAKGVCTMPLKLELDKASAQAIEQLKKAKGDIKILTSETAG